MNGNYTISDVSRISGIPKDLLRMWERRYNYPKPTRDDNGDRIYSDDELRKLLAIRQLLDQGMRPGKLMALDFAELTELLRQSSVEFDFDRLVDLLKAGNVTDLRDWLHQQLQTLGLRAFVHRVIVPANQKVGEAWSEGALAVYQEHLYTEVIKNLVRQSFADIHHAGSRPRVMLTTVPGEMHSLGLLMVEALLRLGGAEAISFGIEMPFRDIREAAQRHRVDVIGLSFSANFKLDDAIVMLSGLRQMIDSKIEIWVGGAAFKSCDELPAGVDLLDGLHSVEQALVRWNSRMNVSVI
ncbi:MAG: MerR family transcriptional regulator [Candidatus Thiodiazotropha sp.]|jgi:methanogenic corrinoid protein MtbC1